MFNQLRILIPLLVLMFFVAPTGNGSKPATDVPNINTSRGFLQMCASVDKKATDQSPFEMFQSGYCVGWMDGLANGIVVAEIRHNITENEIYCPPVGNSFGQMIHIVKKFIADHPEKEHLSTSLIAGLALNEAFPCSEKK